MQYKIGLLFLFNLTFICITFEDLQFIFNAIFKQIIMVYNIQIDLL